MDIYPLDGMLRDVPGESETWILELPLVFAHVATGPKSLLQFTIESRNSALRLFGEQTLHPYAPSNLGLASDRKITTRPVNFIDEEEGGNRLVFVTGVALAPGHDSLPESFELGVKMTFSTNGFVRVPLSASRNGRRGLTLRAAPRRSWKRALPLLNLFLIALGVGVLYGFLLPSLEKIDQGSQDRSRLIPDQAMLQTGLGVLLSFLGLSVGRLRSLFSFVGNPQGVYRWPELHFEPGLLRIFQAPVVTLLLIGMLASEGWLAREVGTPLPKLPEGARLVRGEKQLTSESILRSERAGVKILCEEGDLPLGELTGDGVMWHELDVEDRRIGRKKGPFQFSGLDILESRWLHPQDAPLVKDTRAFLCRNEPQPNVTAEGMKITFHEHKPFSRGDLRDLVDAFRSREFKSPRRDEQQAFADSTKLANKLADQLEKALAERSLSRETWVIVARRLILEIGVASSEKAIIERVVLLRGLLRFAADESDMFVEPAFSEHSPRNIAEAFREAVASRYVGSSEFAAVAELAVELSRSEIGQSIGDELHAAIEAKLPDNNPVMRRVGTMRYARAFVLANGVERAGNPQFCFFASVSSDLETLNPSYRDHVHQIREVDKHGAIREPTTLEESRLKDWRDSVWEGCAKRT